MFGLKDPEPVASEGDESRRQTGDETALYPKELNLHFSLAFSTTILTPSMSVCRSPTFSTPLCHCAYTHTVAVVVYTHTYTLTLRHIPPDIHACSRDSLMRPESDDDTSRFV